MAPKIKKNRENVADRYMAVLDQKEARIQATIYEALQPNRTMKRSKNRVWAVNTLPATCPTLRLSQWSITRIQLNNATAHAQRTVHTAT